MNYHQACELLDRVKYGHMAPEWLINKALQLTGDLEIEDDWIVNCRRTENPYASVSGARGNQDANQRPQ